VNDFLSPSELDALGLRSCGVDVQISRHALLLNPDATSIGDHSRVDAFAVLSAPDIAIGTRAHISAFVSVLGRHRVEIGDFCTVSVRCSIFTSNDDYSGKTLTNPTVPDQLRGAHDGPVHIEEHAIVGAGSIILPGVTIRRGSGVGAMTLVDADVSEFSLVAGVPMRVIGQRETTQIQLGKQVRKSGG
jgi:galactoside O-acetyltransferase